MTRITKNQNPVKPVKSYIERKARAPEFNLAYLNGFIIRGGTNGGSGKTGFQIYLVV